MDLNKPKSTIEITAPHKKNTLLQRTICICLNMQQKQTRAEESNNLDQKTTIESNTKQNISKENNHKKKKKSKRPVIFSEFWENWTEAQDAKVKDVDYMI